MRVGKMISRVTASLCLAAVAQAAAVTFQAGRVEAQAPSSQAVRPGDMFLFIYRQGPTWRAGAPMAEQGLGPHAAYMQRLFSEGRLIAGGQFMSGEGGMAVVLAPNAEEARAMLAADPAITSGIFVATLEQWRPRFRSESPLPRGP
jgi:uncharacterized protein YciI